MNRFTSFATKVALAGSLLGAGLAANAQVNLYLTPITPVGTVTAGSVVRFAVVTDIVQNNLTALTIGAAVTYDTAFFDPAGLTQDPNTGAYPAADGKYNDPLWGLSPGTNLGTTTSGPNGAGVATVQTAAGHAKIGTNKIAPGTHTVCTYSFPTLKTATGRVTIYLPTAFNYNSGAGAAATSSDTLQGAVSGTPALPTGFTFDTTPGSAKPASLTYTIGNSLVPSTTILTGPADNSAMASSSATFTFTGSDSATPTASLLYQYSVDGGAYSTPSPNASVTLNNLAEGQHTFRVAAVNQAGTVDPNPPIRHFAVDLTPPTTTIIGGPLDGGTIAMRSPTFILSGADNLTPVASLRYQYSVDGGAYSAPSTLTSVTLSNLTDGAHTFSVATIDLAGNIDPKPIVRNFSVDATPPTVTILTGPAEGATIFANNPAFTFTGADNLTPAANLKYQYAIDSGAFSTPSTGATAAFSGLTQGTHTFLVQAIDQAGNISASAIRHFTVATPIVNLYLVPMTPTAGTVPAGTVIKFAVVAEITQSVLTSATFGAAVTYDTKIFDPAAFIADPVTGKFPAANGPADPLWNLSPGTLVSSTVTGPTGASLPTIQTAVGHTISGTATITAGTRTLCTFSYPTLPTANGTTTIYLPTAFHYNDGAAADPSASDTFTYTIGTAGGAANLLFPNTTAQPASLTYRVQPLYSVTGKIALEGVSDLTAISPNAPLETFHIGFRTPATRTEVYGADVALTPTAGSAFGSFSLPQVPVGTYDVWIKGAKNLAVLLPNIAVTTAVTLTNVTLPAADGDNSNAVNVLDFGLIVASYGSNSVTPTDAVYDPTADFNFDGLVDVMDFGLLVNEYGRKGAK